MSRPQPVWRLFRGDELLGEITITDSDFPWLEGRFSPQPGFAEVKPWFDEERACGDDLEAWEATYKPIWDTLRMTSPDGPVAEFLLHIEGDRAWFRWSDEAFDDS